MPNASGISLSVVLDNLRSAYNVGSIVRTADGAGISHLYLCGITATLDHPKVAKTALSAEASVKSSYHPNALTLVSDLKSKGMYLAALESRPGAVSLFDPTLRIPAMPSVLIVGNELLGIDPAILELCDQVVALPMMGTKRSLNVVVAFGIASYWLRFGISHTSV
jgi:tRNA G18 (ribose-2'-O)-methylase SpoU